MLARQEFPQPEQRFMTTAQALAFLGISRRAAEKYKQEGVFCLGVHYFQPRPHILRWDAQALLRWLTEDPGLHTKWVLAERKRHMRGDK